MTGAALVVGRPGGDHDPRARAARDPVGMTCLIDVTDGIRVQGLTYVYTGIDRPALSEIDLVFPAGSVTAIVGENGAGKSTLVNVLCRFLTSTAGRVLLWRGCRHPADLPPVRHRPVC